MPSKDWSEQLRHVSFRCGACKHAWQAEPDLVDDDPQTDFHPHRYFGHCPKCKAQNQPQAGWERALMAAHQAATGPITPEGKAASAGNLVGHPTPEEARLTRFNAMKHGMNARVAQYFPPKPGKYAFCGQCDVDRTWCAEQPACAKQTELFMLHHAAVDQRNPKHLAAIHADILAAVTAALQLCLQAVLGEGVLIKQPRVEMDREGNPVTLTYLQADGTKGYIYDYQANPAFKPITDLISRLGLSMGELGLTVKASEEDDPAGAGNLGLGSAPRESLEDFNRRLLATMDAMRDKLGRAATNLRKDPVLIEHEAQGDGA
ncbi:hypothetical protein [Aquabacterium sp.]|uniref:hypothetical protein n=1 Tax=Aquabacterium sp. TaxID=1872578 RepID=UPI0025B894DC|nr:hypothetical protein [Aquabacterium sp.]